MTTGTEPKLDGRTRRRRTNIDAVVDAVIELARADNLDPTSREIAAVAGVAHRSIYRYFDTRAELLEAAVTRAFDSASSDVLGTPSSEAFDDRVATFVAARIEMYQKFRSIARAVTAQSADATASAGLERARLVLRMQLDDYFALELDRLDRDERRIVLALIDAVFQFEALDHLSRVGELDDEQLQQSLARHLHRHLDRHPG